MERSILCFGQNFSFSSLTKRVILYFGFSYAQRIHLRKILHLERKIRPRCTSGAISQFDKEANPSMDQTNNNNRPAPRSGGGQPRKKKRGSTALRIFGRVMLVIFTLCIIGVLSAGIFFKFFMTYVDTTLIPSIPEVKIEELTMSLSSTLYYKDKATDEWKVLDTLHATGGNRQLVEFEDLPDHLIDALVAVEDKRFWEHQGVDWKGTIAATVSTLTGGATRGGSTITQQMLRNITQDNEVTIMRKLREIFRALEFEKKNTKEDILTLYLNYVYFGDGCDGIQTAAQHYFGKDVQDLDLAESAAIIGITNNPSLYTPFLDKEFLQDDGSIKTPRDFNKIRQERILRLMYEEQHSITKEEYEAAKAEKLLFTDTPEYKELHANDPDKEVVDSSAPNTWFVDAVIDDAITLISETQGCNRKMATNLLFSAGYHIYTTLDPDIQSVVDAVYQDPANFNYPSKKGTPMNSAITITDPYTGDVVAMAGGVGVKEQSRTLNLATSRRPCGSAIKPVSVYAPAIDKGIVGPGSIVDDYPIRLSDSGGGYPRNSNGKYRGPVSVSYAVQWSLNTVSARVLESLGYSASFDFMEQNLGFDLDPSDLGVGPLAMGGLTYGVTTEEMAAAFSAFANSGIYTKPRTISRIESNDHTQVIVDNASDSRVAMKESTAYLVTKMLRSVVSGGTGGSAGFSGMSIAGKTGTTSNKFDQYFVGYTPYYSAAVWVGYPNSNERIQAKGNPAAKVWKLVMEPIHKKLENKSFPDRPSGITSVQVCADCGLLPSPLCAQDYRGSRVVSGEFPVDAVPTETCTCHTEVRVCTDPATGAVHLAGEYCPESTCSTRVMLTGREFLPPEGTPIASLDAEAHLTYLETLGPCPIHDVNFVDPDAEPLPGDPGWEWPDWHWPWEKPDKEEPDDGAAEKPSDNTTPGGNNGNSGNSGNSGNGGGSTTPTDPPAPQEPELPAEPELPEN